MSDKLSEIIILQAAIQQAHNCEATHSRTVFVDERFRGVTVWQGDVEVFDLAGHPKASRCFAWLHRKEGRAIRPIILLERSQVDSPAAAVRVAIAFAATT